MTLTSKCEHLIFVYDRLFYNFNITPYIISSLSVSSKLIDGLEMNGSYDSILYIDM